MPNPGVGARISIGYLERESEIRNLIAFCNQFQFIQKGKQSFNIGEGFQQIISFKLDNLKQSLVLLQELKSFVNIDFSHEISGEDQRLKAENCNHLTSEEYGLLDNELKNSLKRI